MVGAPSYAVGWQEPLYLPQPAAGAVWSHKADGRYYERLISASWLYVSSAAGSTRGPLLQLLDGNGTVVLEVGASPTVPVSSSEQISLIVNLGVSAAMTYSRAWLTLPDLLIPPGWSWQATVINLDPADQQSNIVLLVQRFPSDAVSVTAGQ